MAIVYLSCFVFAFISFMIAWAIDYSLSKPLNAFIKGDVGFIGVLVFFYLKIPRSDKSRNCQRVSLLSLLWRGKAVCNQIRGDLKHKKSALTQDGADSAEVNQLGNS